MKEIFYVQSSYILMVLFALFLSGLAWLVAFVVNVTMHDRKELHPSLHCSFPTTHRFLLVRCKSTILRKQMQIFLHFFKIKVMH